jgi:acetyl-CoA acetyltransferase
VPREAVIVEEVRTPVGKRNGTLSGIRPVVLSAHVLRALSEPTGLSPGVIDDVIWGCGSQVGEQTLDIARNAVLAAGWPETVPIVTVDRQCGSSQQSVHFAAAGLISGQYDVVVAGGVESLSRVPMGTSTGGQDPYGSSFRARYSTTPHQGVGASRPLRHGAAMTLSRLMIRSRGDVRTVDPSAHSGFVVDLLKDKDVGATVDRAIHPDLSAPGCGKSAQRAVDVGEQSGNVPDRSERAHHDSRSARLTALGSKVDLL